MLKKKFAKATLWLVAGYALGQGSTFALQLILRQNISAELVGKAFLYLSLFSLCFQFADFGNSTYSNKYLLENKEEKYKRFIIGRSIFAIPVTIIATLFCMPPGLNEKSALLLIFILPIGACLFGMSEVSKVEINNKYRTFAMLQAFPWVATSILIWLSFDRNYLSQEKFPFFWLSIPCMYLLITKTNIIELVKSLNNAKWQEVVVPLAFLLPTLIAQIWGRYMLLLIAELTSITVIGPLGLIRSIHTAGCVMLGFLIRPLLLKYVSDRSLLDNKDAVFLPGKLLWKPILVLFMIFICLVIFPFGIPDDLKFWLPILLGIPIWGMASILTIKNQLTLKPTHFSIIEVLGIGGHMLGFISFISVQPAWAFVTADLFRIVVVYIGWKKFKVEN